MKRRAMVACRIVSVLLVGVATLVARGPVAHATPQSPTTPEKRFDVASVKSAMSPAEVPDLIRQAAAAGAAVWTGMRTLPGGRFQASSVTLKQLIVEAFEVKDYQVEGGPKWLTGDYFAIDASAGGEASRSDIHAMLKALLAERFALKTRLETRQAPVYALTLARSDGHLGPGLAPTSPECLAQIEARRKAAAASGQPLTPPPAPRLNPRALPTTPICGRSMILGGAATTMLYSAGEVSFLLGAISNEMAGPAVDRTGLTGPFDIVLQYTPEQIAGRRGLDPNSNDTPPPPLGVALEKQLGLKVEKQLGPLSFVIIDSAEHPTPD
jgi:uncharacterized protein (TIGR03435 family)